jgi:hypothetical protein
MTTAGISERRRRELIDALRRGTVPRNGLDALAIGLERFEAAIDEELDNVAAGSAVFKAVRGEYGAGKTSSPAGWSSGPSVGAWPRPRSRSRKPRRRCTAWKPSTGC